MELDSQSVTDPSVDVSLQSIELGSPNARCNAAAQNRPLGPCRFCSKTVLVRFPPCLASSSAAFAGRLQGPVTIVKVKKRHAVCSRTCKSQKSHHHVAVAQRVKRSTRTLCFRSTNNSVPTNLFNLSTRDPHHRFTCFTHNKYWTVK